jgi:hypothetical protein
MSGVESKEMVDFPYRHVIAKTARGSRPYFLLLYKGFSAGIIFAKINIESLWDNFLMPPVSRTQI